MCGVIFPFKNGPSHMLIFEPSNEDDSDLVEPQLCVVTRSQSSPKVVATPTSTTPAPAVVQAFDSEPLRSFEDKGPMFQFAKSKSAKTSKLPEVTESASSSKPPVPKKISIPASSIPTFRFARDSRETLPPVEVFEDTDPFDNHLEPPPLDIIEVEDDEDMLDEPESAFTTEMTPIDLRCREIPSSFEFAPEETPPCRW